MIIIIVGVGSFIEFVNIIIVGIEVIINGVFLVILNDIVEYIICF